MKTLPLNLERERRLNEILGQALESSPDELETFLDGLPEKDVTLAAEVRKLLAEEGLLGGFLEEPAVVVSSLETESEAFQGTNAPIPSVVGPFRVLESLGEGGMGRVFLAEQTEPARRQVALKLIRTSLAGAEATARFSAERQALARLSHPNIAQIFEAGTTEDGFPYFAMEYVPGDPVTEYCDTHRLSLDQRLKLFTTLCRAVQHAHSKGIIHRDLKPSNLLVMEVDGQPVPKVIDFGIAKALDQPLTDATILTAQRIIGTPAYMSPEALFLDDDGGDVDTRTDVYALGILLYELVAGARPFETSGASMAQVLRKIAEEDAQRPTTRFRSLSLEAQAIVAEQRQMDLRSFRHRLASDLGWIAMKAIAKRRTDRYASASELAEDVERHLRHEPVLAGPPSFFYRAGKTLRRNRGKLTAAGVALLLGTTAVTIQVRSSLRADRLARLSEQLGREVERIEWVQRVAYQLPKQNISAEHERIRGRMDRMKSRMQEIGKLGSGPGSYALGRGALALGDLDSARGSLEAALEAGYDRPEVSLTLGLTLDALYQRRLEEIDRMGDSRDRKRLRQQADEELRAPARALMSRSGDADTIAPELLEAHVALFDGDWDKAEAKSLEARSRLPWLFEAAFLEGRVSRQRAGEAWRENDLEAANRHLLKGEEAVLAGLAVGRSDPRGFFQLCSLRAFRLNLAAHYALPDARATLDTAIEACSDARLVDPTRRDVDLQEAIIWIDWADVELWDLGESPEGSLARSEEKLLRVLESSPRNAEAYRYLGRAKALEATHRTRAGDDPRASWKQGLEYLDRGYELAPNLLSLRLLMSRMLSDRAAYVQYRGGDPTEDLDRATTLLRGVLAIDPENERGWFYLANSLVFRGDHRRRRGVDPLPDFEEAARALRRARELDPNLRATDNNMANLDLLVGKWLFEIGRDPLEALERTITNAGLALAAGGEPAFPNFLTGHAYLEKARYSMGRGESPEANIRLSREFYSRGLRLLPRIPGPHVDLTVLALLEGRYLLEQGSSPLASAAEAEAHGRQALDADSDRADARRALGLASLLRAEWRFLRGENPKSSFTAARREMEASLELDPEDAKTHLAFARLAWRRLEFQPSGGLTEEEASSLLGEGLLHAAEAQRLNPARAEALALEGALKSLSPASGESEGLVTEALRRNGNLAHPWQRWLDRQREEPDSSIRKKP